MIYSKNSDLRFDLNAKKNSRKNKKHSAEKSKTTFVTDFKTLLFRRKTVSKWFIDVDRIDRLDVKNRLDSRARLLSNWFPFLTKPQVSVRASNPCLITETCDFPGQKPQNFFRRQIHLWWSSKFFGERDEFKYIVHKTFINTL